MQYYDSVKKLFDYYVNIDKTIDSVYSKDGLEDKILPYVQNDYASIEHFIEQCELLKDLRVQNPNITYVLLPHEHYILSTKINLDQFKRENEMILQIVI